MSCELGVCLLVGCCVRVFVSGELGVWDVCKVVFVMGMLWVCVSECCVV